MFFGPDVLQIGELVVGEDKTVYIAGGAVVQAMIKPEEKLSTNKETGLRNYAVSIPLIGKNITIRQEVL